LPKATELDPIKTQRGRVVYERKKHFYNQKAIARICRATIENGEDQEVREESAVFLAAFAYSRIRALGKDIDWQLLLDGAGAVVFLLDQAEKLLQWQLRTALDIMSAVFGAIYNGIQGLIQGENNA
jgi:hypothetical protein